MCLESACMVMPSSPSQPDPEDYTSLLNVKVQHFPLNPYTAEQTAFNKRTKGVTGLLQSFVKRRRDTGGDTGVRADLRLPFVKLVMELGWIHGLLKTWLTAPILVTKIKKQLCFGKHQSCKERFQATSLLLIFIIVVCSHLTRSFYRDAENDIMILGTVLLYPTQACFPQSEKEVIWCWAVTCMGRASLGARSKGNAGNSSHSWQEEIITLRPVAGKNAHRKRSQASAQLREGALKAQLTKLRLFMKRCELWTGQIKVERQNQGKESVRSRLWLHGGEGVGVCEGSAAL